jgi:hypothetical protein
MPTAQTHLRVCSYKIPVHFLRRVIYKCTRTVLLAGLADFLSLFVKVPN